MRRCEPLTLFLTCAAGALLVPSLVLSIAFGQPEAPASTPSESQDLAATLATRAEQLRESGDPASAALRALVALTLDPDNPRARTALARAAAAIEQTPPADDMNGAPAPAGADDPSQRALPADFELRHRIAEERQRREEIELELNRILRLVNQQNEQIIRLESAVTDRGRAEPNTERLERELDDAKREIDRVRGDMARLQREVSRLQTRPR